MTFTLRYFSEFNDLMNSTLSKINNEVYKPCNLNITAFNSELESAPYDACKFQLNGLKIISRSSKITPKKVGQFVTFWKRDGNGPITPFEASGDFDFFVVQVKTERNLGQFVFPKAILIKKGILSTPDKEGKRAFRVYPIWDYPVSKIAKRSQKWQLKYFYLLKTPIDTVLIKRLYIVDTI